MQDFIVIVILVLVVGSAGFYIWKAKKNGRKCIGCPASSNGTCPKCCGGKSK